ncbi:MAG: YebC/PmpR family DNA-binding transcriptional regulator [Psychrobium sp.]|nr:YebC/PmpR family DNA-binding transcriptional regulator [Psychrobium sp.]
MGRSFENRKASMAKTQGAKVRVYSRYGKEIYVSAKNGGADPDTNISLRRLIEKAKKDQVPTHVIGKAIEKALGGGGENYETARYEGFGPGGAMVIVDCLTDNNKRTYTEVRNCFMKSHAKIGSTGTVAHMFDHLAILRYVSDDEDAAFEALLDADVDVTDIESEDGKITVFAPHTEFFKAKSALLALYPDLEFEVEEITFVAQNETEISGDDVEAFEKFEALLDDCDDVQNIYHNAVF